MLAAAPPNPDPNPAEPRPLLPTRSQLTSFELLVLTSTVMVSASAPWLLPVKLVELIVPSMAALSAAIGLSAEYIGPT